MPTRIRLERRKLLQELVDDLVGATTDDIKPTGAYAVDTTAIDTPARRRLGQEGFNDNVKKIHAHKPLHDVDARIGHRTKTYANRTQWVYGYQLLAMTRVATDKDRDAPVPGLIDRISLVPGNESAIPETLAGLTSLKAAGLRTDEILVDKGFSQAHYDTFRGPLSNLKVDVVLDLKVDDHIVVPHKDQGFLIIDGYPYCPTLPQHLRKLHLNDTLWAKNTEGRRHATQEEQDAWDERVRRRREFEKLIEERNTYRLESKGSSKNGKGVRYTCRSLRGAEMAHDGHPPVHQRETCCKQWITIPHEVLGKHRQKHIWGTPQWRRSYNRRPDIERKFGRLKSTDGFICPGWTLQVGLVKLSLAVAITIMAYNQHVLTQWAKTRTIPDSVIANMSVWDKLTHDPDPGIDMSTLPEAYRPHPRQPA